jgi:pyridoxal phosphate enzyme (YggS family)
LIAVSKTIDVERIGEALGAGQTLFGENRVQEALGKIEKLPGATWHLIGHLQRNKARQAVGKFEMIHGVDTPELAAALDKQAGKAGIRQQVLIQANLSNEVTKHGAKTDEVPPLAQAIEQLAHLDLCGLMIIPPFPETPEDSRPWFRRLAEMRDRAAEFVGRPLPELSMGMTADFEVAIEEGATMVRVGRAIFGERR